MNLQLRGRTRPYTPSVRNSLPGWDDVGDLMAPTSRKKVVVAPLTEEELDSVTIVFHQFETGLREGTIYTKVRRTQDLKQKTHD